MSKEQFETKLEKDRAKEAFVENRFKTLKKRAEKLETESPKLAKFAKLLETISFSGTDEQKIKKLEDQFEKIYADTERKGKIGMTGKERVEAQANTIKKSKDGGIVKLAKGGDPSKFGMLSVKAGVDNNPKPTQADRIVGATKKMKKGGIVKKKPSRTRIAKRGFGIAKRGY